MRDSCWRTEPISGRRTNTRTRYFFRLYGFQTSLWHACSSSTGLTLHRNSCPGHLQSTLLHKAVGIYGASVVALIIKMGVDLDTLDGHRNKQPHTAIICANEPVVRHLMEHGVSPDPYALQSALEYARGDPERKIIKLLLKHGADLTIRDDAEGGFPLHLAEKADIVHLLVENGAPINALDLSGMNALHLYIRHLEDFIKHRLRAWLNTHSAEDVAPEAVDLCRAHLEHGADINIRNDSGQTVFDMVYSIGLPHTREALLGLSYSLGNI